MGLREAHLFLRGTNVLGRKENFLGTFVPKNVPRRGTFVPKIRENVPMELGCNTPVPWAHFHEQNVTYRKEELFAEKVADLFRFSVCLSCHITVDGDMGDSHRGTN